MGCRDHRFPHFGYIHLGGGGTLMLDRCRAFDLLQVSMPTSGSLKGRSHEEVGNYGKSCVFDQGRERERIMLMWGYYVVFMEGRHRQSTAAPFCAQEGGM
jgi:hypothetical protein